MTVGPNDKVSGIYFGLSMSERMLKVLDAARMGSLAASWRDDLQLRQQQSGAVSDAERLAVEEIRMLPVEPWEPGHATSWRQALNTWYAASRKHLADQTAAHMRIMADQVSSGHRIFTTALAVSRVTGDDRTLDQLNGPLAAADQTGDRSRGTREELYIQARDRLTASYLAGLASQGEAGDIDWMQWFKNRVASWTTNYVDTRRADIEINSTSFRSLMERLPQYWV